MTGRPNATIDRRALPWRVRCRLWRNRRVDGLAIWLVNHRHFSMAKRLWRIEP